MNFIGLNNQSWSDEELLRFIVVLSKELASIAEERRFDPLVPALMVVAQVGQECAATITSNGRIDDLQ